MNPARIALVVALLALPAAFLAGSATSARAQDKPASKSEDPKERKLQKVRDLMASMNQRDIASKGIDVALENFKSMGLPEDFTVKFKERFDIDELIENTVQIYAGHLEEEEVDAMVAFYKSESGKKIAAEMPAITIEAMKMGQEYGKRVAQEIAGGK
jgi:FlaG/FlaF family flagellin (archaellin)